MSILNLTGFTVQFKVILRKRIAFFFFLPHSPQTSVLGVNVLAHWVRNFQMHFFVVVVVSYLSSFPIKMLATDAKTQKIKPDLNFFYDGRMFRRQCVNVIDTTWGRIYFFVWKFRTQCAMTFSLMSTHEILRKNGGLLYGSNKRTCTAMHCNYDSDMMVNSTCITVGGSKKYTKLHTSAVIFNNNGLSKTMGKLLKHHDHNSSIKKYALFNYIFRWQKK